MGRHSNKRRAARRAARARAAGTATNLARVATAASNAAQAVVAEPVRHNFETNYQTYLEFEFLRPCLTLVLTGL